MAWLQNVFLGFVLHKPDVGWLGDEHLPTYRPHLRLRKPQLVKLVAKPQTFFPQPAGDGGGREQSGSIDKSVDRELYWRSKLSPSVSHSSPRYAPDKRWVTGADATLSRCHLSHPALPFFSWYTQSLTLVWSRRAVLYLICDPNRQSPTPTVTLYGDPLWRRWPRVTQRPGENDTGCLDVRFSRTDIIRENISPQHRCYLGKPI